MSTFELPSEFYITFVSKSKEYTRFILELSHILSGKKMKKTMVIHNRPFSTLPMRLLSMFHVCCFQTSNYWWWHFCSLWFCFLTPLTLVMYVFEFMSLFFFLLSFLLILFSSFVTTQGWIVATGSRIQWKKQRKITKKKKNFFV